VPLDFNPLSQLSEQLFACGILPYYLHTLDKAKGAAHFDISEEKEKQLHQSLQKNYNNP